MVDHVHATGPKSFAHLHQHTSYSLLDGAARIKDLVTWVKEVTPGQAALAMTDHGNMHGAIEFYKACASQGVQPIVGFEAYVAAGSRFEKKRPEGRLDGGYHHLTLLAKDMAGYRNLCQLSSRAYLEGFYMKPRVDYELLQEHREGVIALSGCLGAVLPRTLLDVGFEAGEEVLQRYLQVFGDDYFIELQDHGLPDQKRLNPMLKELANKYGLGMVATNDGHYVRKEDARAHEALLSIQTKTVLSDEDRFRFPCDEFYVKTPEEMAEAIDEAEYQGALANTMVVAARCNLELPIGDRRVYQMPEVPLPAGRSLVEQLRLKSYEGLGQRYPDRVTEAMWRRYLEVADSSQPAIDHVPAADDAPLEQVWLRLAGHAERVRLAKQADGAAGRDENPLLDALSEVWDDEEAMTILRRAEFELGVIMAMGYPDYFLIVADFIGWAKDQGIAVGPGRGSGAGSIVAYALRITDIDPLVYGLLFERFLNPDRVSLPDFDIDFSDLRRNEVVDYVRRTYGDDKVALIATFNTMASRAAIKDAARVMEASFTEADRLSKLVPAVYGRSVPISQALEEIPEFKQLYQAGAQPYVDMAMRLEGLTRNASVHAAGVIISRRPIVELAPVFRSGDGPIVCQYGMASVEELGFLKMDFLGLRTLSFIETAVRIVQQVQGITLDPSTFPLDDPDTFALFARGDTAGVFQYESSGMVDTLRKLKPGRIQDLIAVNALYRPGPMENIPAYIRRHHGTEPVSYDDTPNAAPLLTPILEETHGIPVYQEQIMQIGRAVAGYSLGEADLLRKAMGKKQITEMVKHRVIFEEGAKAKGIPAIEANRIFDLLERFANYGFNKAHSAAYSLLGYQTAYLKTHYPLAFIAALLTVERGNSDKVAEYITDARHLGIEVRPPDINTSTGDFTPDGQVVRFGLYGVKNVGDTAVDHLLIERDSGGRFKDLYDFCRRVDGRLLNKRALESLIKGGAFDGIGDRAAMLADLEAAMKWGASVREQEAGGQMGLFAVDELRPPSVSSAQPIHPLELLRMEKDALGLYLSDHPMSEYPGLAEAATCTVAGVDSWWRDLAEEQGTVAGGRQRVALTGLLQNVSKRPTKKGNMMARFELADHSGSREVVAFGRVFDEIAGLLQADAPVLLVCEVSEDGEALRLVAEKMLRWDRRGNGGPRLPELAVLSFDLDGVGPLQLRELRALLDDQAGPLPVRLFARGEEGVVQYEVDGVRVAADGVGELSANLPWLQASISVDPKPWMAAERGRNGNGWGRKGGEGGMASGAAEVPF